MALLRRLLCVCLLLVGVSGGVVQAGDWFQNDLVASLDDPLRLSRIRGLGFSLQAGKHRAEVERDGSSGVARSLTLIPTLMLSTTTKQPFRPYIGAGLGLSLSELAPGDDYVPLNLEENFIMHVGGGFSYRFAPGLAFTSSARYTQSWDSDLFARFASPQLPLGNGGLGLNNLSVRFGIRMKF